MASWILSALLCAAVGADTDCAIVHFTATWCEPCKQVEPALAQLQREGWTVHTVDVDRQPELVQQFRVENLPTLAILCRQQEVDRMVGAAPYDRILERVTRAAARNQNGAAAVTAGAPAHDHGHDHDHAHPHGHDHAPAQTADHTGMVVRGQSPGMAAFPLLAAAGSFGNQQPTPPAEELSQLAATQSAGITVEQAVARAAAATVRIRVDEANSTAYGTGTIVDVRGQEALILTCGHLFRDMQPHSQLTVDLFAGTPREINVPAELIDFKAEEEDIGLISFRLPTPVEPVPILARGEKVAVGQPVFSFGCDHGADPTRRDTQVKTINRYLGADNIEIVGAPVLGRSGGGLFDMQGRLIGVCNAANPQDDEGIYAANNVVYNQIERLGLSELFAGSQPQGASASPVQLASTSSGSASGWQDSAGAGTPPVASVAAVGASSPTAAAAQPMRWPDQPAMADAGSARQDAGQAAPNQSATGGASGVNGSPQQIICIVRDASGQDQLLTIDAPPQQLMQMLKQSSRR